MDREGWVIGVVATGGHIAHIYFQTFELANAFLGHHAHCTTLERFHVSRNQARAQEPAQAERSAPALSGEETAMNP